MTLLNHVRNNTSAEIIKIIRICCLLCAFVKSNLYIPFEMDLALLYLTSQGWNKTSLAFANNWANFFVQLVANLYAGKIFIKKFAALLIKNFIYTWYGYRYKSYNIFENITCLYNIFFQIQILLTVTYRLQR